jgi:hypothetical protein
MASLQLSLIHESTIRQALATDLKQIIDITDVDQSLSLNETANNLLNGTALFVDDALLEDTAVTHPRLAEAIRALAKYQQPTAVRFGHLQQQMYHAAKHRVTERHEIAETLKACGLSGLAKKMTQEAVFIEMSYSRPMVAD